MKTANPEGEKDQHRPKHKDGFSLLQAFVIKQVPVLLCMSCLLSIVN